MVDWLEELLAAMDGDEDEQEDAPALEIERAATAVPAPAPEAGAGGRGAGRPEGAEAGQAARLTERGGPEGALCAGYGPRESRWLGEGAPPGDAPGGPWAGGSRTAETRAIGEMGSGTASAGEAEAGLEALYRQTAQAARPPLQSMAGWQAAQAWPLQGPEGAAALTVDELDRAVKRDSRRYDGGMSIF